MYRKYVPGYNPIDKSNTDVSEHRMRDRMDVCSQNNKDHYGSACLRFIHPVG